MTMPLLFLLLLLATPQPVQAHQYDTEYRTQERVVVRKYIQPMPCYTFLQRDFTEHTVCPSRYILVFSDGAIVPVSQEVYNRQVIGRSYIK